MSGRTSELTDAVSELFRMVVEPEAVVDFVTALHALDADIPDETLAAFQRHVAVAETLSERIQVRPAKPQVEYLLLSKSQRVIAAADTGRLFDEIATGAAPGQTFALRDPDAQLEFGDAVRSLTPGGQRFIAVRHREAEPALTIAVARAQSGDRASSDAEFMVAAPRSASWSADLQRAFLDLNLTAAEVRVLRAMRTDQSAVDLAERLGVAESTVRSQIKSLLGKIGVSRQAELVRFREEAMRLSGVITEQMKAALADAAESNPPFFPSGRARPPRMLLTLSNGRRVSYREFGAGGGSVVVVLHGAHSGSMIPEGFKPGAGRLGLRLIAPDRPGYGQSSPSRADLWIEEAARETIELLNRLDVERYDVVTLASSAAAGVEIARSDPRVRTLTLCSPHFGAAPLPGASPGFGLLLQRSLVQRAPWLMERASRVLWSSMSWQAARNIARGLLKRSPADLRQLAEDGLDAYFADVVIDARQTPPDGQIWEARALSAYRIDLAGLQASVTLVFGEEDPVTDKAGMCALFGAPSRARVVTRPGGQLFYYHQWPDVLETLVQER